MELFYGLKTEHLSRQRPEGRSLLASVLFTHQVLHAGWAAPQNAPGAVSPILHAARREEKLTSETHTLYIDFSFMFTYWNNTIKKSLLVKWFKYGYNIAMLWWSLTLYYKQ